jgi:hypothetical protein
MSAHEDTADSIVEHARSLATLDPHMPARAWSTAVAVHVRTIRLLAAPYVDGAVDRPFYTALKAASLQVDGVFVHTPGGQVEMLVDTRRGQQRFELLSPQALRELDAG